MPSTILRHALALIPALFLAACGGGGGGGSSDNSVAAASQLAITAGNSQAVAAESLEASANYENATAGGALLPIAVQIDNAGGVNPVLLANAARTLLSKAQGGPALATGVTTSNNCSGGGTLTVTQSVASSSGVLAAGDSFSFEANNCAETVNGVSTRMNGSMSISIVSGSFDPNGTYPRSITIRTVARSFTLVQGGDTMVANGDVTIALTEQSATDVSVSVSSSAMSSTIGSHSVTLKGYTHKVAATGTGTTIEMGATVETNNSRFGGSLVSYTITTTTPLVVNASGQVTAGEIKVTGANGTSLVLTVTATDTFALKVDGDGNGTYETTTTVSRTTLVGLL